MGHGGNVIDELKADHREVEEMFGRLKAMTGGGQELRGLIDEITIELVRHSVAEEQYLYPAVREQVEGGGRMADREIEDHSRVEKILKQLEQISTDDAQIKPLLKQLMEEVTSHIKDEESNLFPALQGACTSQQLDDLGDKIRRAKAMAPTRPHPAAPSSPTASKLLAPGAGLVDRARDFVTGRGTS